jgi:hypothetical protein
VLQFEYFCMQNVRHSWNSKTYWFWRSVVCFKFGVEVGIVESNVNAQPIYNSDQCFWVEWFIRNRLPNANLGAKSKKNTLYLEPKTVSFRAFRQILVNFFIFIKNFQVSRCRWILKNKTILTELKLNIKQIFLLILFTQTYVFNIVKVTIFNFLLHPVYNLLYLSQWHFFLNSNFLLLRCRH